MNGNKKLKFQSKQTMQAPFEFDSTDLQRIEIDFYSEQAKLWVRLLDGGVEKEVRPIVMGLGTLRTAMDLDTLEENILDVVQSSGVLPTGGKVENK
jgi:hypothetical protein